MIASLRSLVRRHPLPAFFAIAYLITWAVLLPLALATRNILPVHFPPWWHALGAAGPLCAAFVVTRIVGGSPAVREWSRGLVRWRVPVRWWLLAVVSPFGLFAVSALIMRLFGAPSPDFARLSAPAYANGVWVFDLLFVGTFAYAIGEEPGWRGFALPQLQRHHNSLVATLILTPLWAIFHWPAFFYRPSYQGGLPTIVGFLFGLLAGAIVLTFLYNATRGSLLLVILWHALVNIVMQVASVVSQPVLALMNVFIAIGAVAIVGRWVAYGDAIEPQLLEPAPPMDAHG